MANFASNPLFGIVLSIWAYLIGMLIFRRYPHPITTPLLVATVIVILFLMITGISYKRVRLLCRWFPVKSVDWTIDSRLGDSSL